MVKYVPTNRNLLPMKLQLIRCHLGGTKCWQNHSSNNQWGLRNYGKASNHRIQNILKQYLIAGPKFLYTYE